MICVRFTCKACALTRAPVYVREREPAEDVRDWFRTVREAVGSAHGVYSPECSSDLVDLEIPCNPDGSGIGYTNGPKQ